MLKQELPNMIEYKNCDACRWRLAEAPADASDAPKLNKSCMTYIPLSFIIIGANHFREGLGLRVRNRKGGYSKSPQLNSVGTDRLDRLADNDDNEPGVTSLQSDNSNVLCFSR